MPHPDLPAAERPRATYRLQLAPSFDLDAAAALVPQLAELGITHVYASPLFEAVPGSTHGYDATDPTRIRDELGGAGAFARLLAALRADGLGLVLDIVPNHLAADPGNRWWWDVLEDGPSSAGAAFFDIDWAGGGDASTLTVLVPVLGDHYGRAIEAGAISLHREGGGIVVRAGEHRLPLSPRTFDEVLGPAARAIGSSALAELATGCAGLPDARRTDAAAVAERHRRKLELGRELADLVASDPDAASAIDVELERIGADPDRLDVLLRRQNYRLARWRTASDELDYRRFFSIESLVAVRVEDPDVLAETHALVRQLVAEGSVDGLRVDHVDGLRDPARYLEELRAMAPGAPIVVEKILAPDESLPDWPVQGTTGYEVANLLAGVFVERANVDAVTATYVDATGDEPDFALVARQAKREIMGGELAAEVDRLTLQLARICERRRRHRDHTVRELREALVELIASFDVYRTYVVPGHDPSDADRGVLQRARERAHRAVPAIDVELLDLLGDLAAGRGVDEEERDLCLRLQQVTAPVMAKGVEDTAFYRHHRLISLNEVGGEPSAFGRTTAELHEAMGLLADRWPETMVTLSTHDTKRSADVRSRISVLSEEPAAWSRAVERWQAANDHHWAGSAPDRSTEYLLYQTLVGAWPLSTERALAFVEKAVREAKVHTSWTDPDEAYEAGVLGFVRGVLEDPVSRRLVGDLLQEIDLVERGRRSSLVQLALLLTCPGSPDLYQGTERWDLSLTDPDNRRPVDHGATGSLLAAAAAVPPATVLQAPLDDVAKPWLVRRLLHLRGEQPETFVRGGYDPIPVDGGSVDAIAYRRGRIVVVAPVRTGATAARGSFDLPGRRWSDALDGHEVRAGRHELHDVLGGRPVAVLVEEGS